MRSASARHGAIVRLFVPTLDVVVEPAGCGPGSANRRRRVGGSGGRVHEPSLGAKPHVPKIGDEKHNAEGDIIVGNNQDVAAKKAEHAPRDE